MKSKIPFQKYFFSFLLVPWVIVWGLAGVVTILTWYYNLRPKNSVILDFELSQIFSSQIYLTEIWLAVMIFLFINHTTAFVLSKTYPKLNYLFFAVSVFLLFILTAIVLPHIFLVLGVQN
jgi:hypothetical protein